MKKQIPKECKKCVHLWTGGIKDNKHDRWCCAYGGGPSWKQIGHCKNNNFEKRILK